MLGFGYEVNDTCNFIICIGDSQFRSNNLSPFITVLGCMHGG